MPAIYSDQSVVFGVFNVPHAVVDVPEGYTVARVRYRADYFTTVFLRSARGFEQWHVEFADAEKKTIRPLYRMAANIRKPNA